MIKRILFSCSVYFKDIYTSSKMSSNISSYHLCKRLHHYGLNHDILWENSLFQWAIFNNKLPQVPRGYIYIYICSKEYTYIYDIYTISINIHDYVFGWYTRGYTPYTLWQFNIDPGSHRAYKIGYNHQMVIKNRVELLI